MERSAVTKLVPDFIWIDLGRQVGPGTQSQVVTHHHLFIISPRYPEPGGAAPPPVYHFTPVPRARWCRTTTCLSFNPGTQSQVVPHHHLFIISPRYPEPAKHLHVNVILLWAARSSLSCFLIKSDHQLNKIW